MRSLQRKTNFIFYQIFGIGLIFLGLFLFFGIGLYPWLTLVGRSLVNKLVAICGCSNHWSFANHPFIFSAVILGGAGLLVFLGWLAIKFYKLSSSTNKFVRYNFNNRRKQLGPKLRKAAESLGLQGRIIEADDKNPIVFCFGFFRPKICASSGLIGNIDESELRAILLHEKFHLDAGQPIKIFAVNLIAKFLFFVPGVKLLKEKYLCFAELAADEQATDGFRNKVPLAKALGRFMGLRERLISQNNLALSFFSVTEERINKLSDSRYLPNFKILTWKTTVSVLLMVSFFAGFGYFLFSSSLAVASQEAGSCAAKVDGKESQCQMTDEGECQMGLEMEDMSCERHNTRI